VESHRVETAISIGISLFSGDGSSVDDLLAQADRAMYQAKRNGGNACRFSPVGIPAELNAARCPPTWPASATPAPE
jgi:predicted signal transduction protein with EAL and GGDEF domain